MKTTRLNKLFIVLVSVMALSLTVAFVFANSNLVNAGETPSFEMVEGASIRLGTENESGIRFTAKIPDVNKDYKVLIVYKQMLEGVTNPDVIQGLVDKFSANGVTLDNFTQKFTVVDNIIPIEDETYGWVINGSIVQIPNSEFGSEFIGIAYYEEGGVRTYANYNLSNSRSIKDVSYRALADKNVSWSENNKETFLSYLGEYENDVYAHTNVLLNSTTYFGGNYKTTISSQVVSYAGNTDGITTPSGLENSNTYVKNVIKGSATGQFFGGVPIWFDSETNPMVGNAKKFFANPENSNIFIGFYINNKSRFNVNVALLGADNVGDHFNNGKNDYGFVWDVTPSQDWKYVEFPLKDLNINIDGSYKFGIGLTHWDENATTATSQDCVYIDGLTFINKPRGVAFTASTDGNFNNLVLTDGVSFEYKITSGDHFNISLFNNSNWDKYYGYYEFTANGARSNYAGITTTKLPDGYVKVDVVFDQLNRTGNSNNKEKAPELAVNYLYVRGAWTDANGYIDNIQDFVEETPEIPVDEDAVYTINYILNGGLVDNPTTYNAKDEFVLHNPIKEDKAFLGWTYEGQSTPQLVVKINEGTVGNKTFTANYTNYSFAPLKVAVFADIQLTNNNQGSTANAYLALKNHFKYAKSINAEVILMSGDIVNNAVKEYYDLFINAFKEVYGNDENEYPEFVMNMGNHEWWDLNEHETANAVSLFKEYARIDSENLVRQSKNTYYLDSETTLPSYYKVIKGVPFLVVSAGKSNGEINDNLKNEISGWLQEISRLPSVKNGGPIYVSYHYPIPNVTYKGEHTEPSYAGIDALLKNYPNAIVFTGDTHFNGVNERTINQVDYTSINIGSSSYSRSISESATGFIYNNVNKGSGKSSAGTMLGDINFKHEYTPTIMIITMDNALQTKIDRYYTANNISEVKRIGKTWVIPQITNKSSFTYTNDRIQNTSSAVDLYGKIGLEWENSETVKFNVEGTKMLVNFNDVIDFNCVEHYRITVKDSNNSSNVKYYYFMSHYYKYDSTAHTYNFVLENIPVATNYTVTVTAYDFFDNPSTNNLVANTENNRLYFSDDIDSQTMNTYSDISKMLNYQVKDSGSNSSVEYYYRGIRNYQYGMILNRVIYTKGDNLNNYISINEWSNPTLTMRIKNANNYEMYFSLTVVTDSWLTDGGNEYKLTVPANSGWTTLSWNLKDLFNVTSNTITQLGVKAFVPNYVVDAVNGYEVSFFVDNIDVINTNEEIPEVIRGEQFTANTDYSVATDATTYLSFDYKLTSSGDMAISLMSSDWQKYYGYYMFDNNGAKESYAGITTTKLADGYVCIEIDISKLNKTNNESNIDNAPSVVGILYVRGIWTTANGYIDRIDGVAPYKVNAFDSNVNYRKNDTVDESAILSLSSAKNESELGQIIITAMDSIANGKKYTVELSDLTNVSSNSKLLKSNFEIYNGYYINVNTNWNKTAEHASYLSSSYPNGYTTLPLGYYVDALVPFSSAVSKNENVINTLNGNNHAIYINVKVPAIQEAGLYKGNFKVSVAGLGEIIVPVEYTVYDFVLPTENNAKNSFEINKVALNRIYGGGEGVENVKYADLFNFLLDYNVSAGQIPVACYYEEQFDEYKTALKNYIQDERVSAINLYANYTSAHYYYEYKKNFYSSTTIVDENYSAVIMEESRRTNDFGGGKRLTKAGMKFVFESLAKASINENFNYFEKLFIRIGQNDEPSEDKAYRESILSYNAVRRSIDYALNSAEINWTGHEDIKRSLNNVAYLVTCAPVNKVFNGELFPSNGTTNIYYNADGEVQAQQDITLTYRSLKDYIPLFNNFNYGSDNSIYNNIISMMDDSEDSHTHVWWYGCCQPINPYPSYITNSNHVISRASRWAQFDLGVEGELYYGVNQWKNGSDATLMTSENDIWSGTSNHEGAFGDGVLVYSAYERYAGLKYCPTYRLFNIRESIDDYNYLYYAQSLINALSGNEKITAQERFDAIVNTIYKSGATNQNKIVKIIDDAVILTTARTNLANLIADIAY